LFLRCVLSNYYFQKNEVFTSTPLLSNPDSLEEQFENFKIPDKVKFTREIKTPIERKKSFRRLNTPKPVGNYSIKTDLIRIFINLIYFLSLLIMVHHHLKKHSQKIIYPHLIYHLMIHLY
jgi:hypothetical protein